MKYMYIGKHKGTDTNGDRDTDIKSDADIDRNVLWIAKRKT